MRKRWLWWIPIGLILIIIAGAVFYIRPVHTLDLNASEMNWKPKLREMLETRTPILHLNQDEVNQLAKQKLATAVNEGTLKLPFTLTGAKFIQQGHRIKAEINGRWGIIPFGATAVYEIDYEGGLMVLTPIEVKVKDLNIKPSNLGLKVERVSPDKELPSVIQIKDILFQDQGIEIPLTLNWLELLNIF
ncbi:hypothetical protein J2Z69_003526 [Paenibacillus shirakamiensis]|uniref:DUF2140 family protein n=1 Tax=Paenibacillus shirakamiensis TaxID=1265935 RepID=A0ABS4JL72_9BACL|nr:hypothetical protein [Paenibacillus shirakamiensis]MBP2002453.1 hypothetical protein [Paenibacillus shirakamiensis]